MPAPIIRSGIYRYETIRYCQKNCRDQCQYQHQNCLRKFADAEQQGILSCIFLLYYQKRASTAKI